MSPDLDEFSHFTVPELARLLTEAAGEPVTLAMLRADLAAGASLNPDGTVSLLHYAAWMLARRHQKRA